MHNALLFSMAYRWFTKFGRLAGVPEAEAAGEVLSILARDVRVGRH
jgi:hypothetical protein